ncbi:MAG: VWA domain-containing protein [Flavobacteriales bacterium]|nr:VWA domain-containing protein [Flavobacteriales bacterium]
MLSLAVLCTASGPLIAQSGPAEKPGDDAEKTRILFVFDASNSMNAYWGHNRKWDVATALLSASLDSLYGIDGLELGLRVYGHQTRHVQGMQDCDDTELLVPIGKGTNLVIRKELERLRAQGTTPIARSLLHAADDFALTSGPGRNVIILITDGVEACDEDPCAVSRALQGQGIIVRPFIIGIGLEQKYKETFRCVGNYFDASDKETFERVLDIVISQALHNTTAQIDLLDHNNRPLETDVPISIYEHNAAGPVSSNNHFVHTMNRHGRPDTLVLSPVPLYRVVAHTIPKVVMDSVKIESKTHNHIAIPAAQGWLDLSTGRLRSDLQGVRARVMQNGCELVHIQTLGSKVKYLAGTYDLEIATTPVTFVKGVEIGGGKVVPVAVPEPGVLSLNTGTPGYGGIFIRREGQWELALPFNGQNPTGRYTIQPGEYMLVFRAKRAKDTTLSAVHNFTMRSGAPTHLNLLK